MSNPRIFFIIFLLSILLSGNSCKVFRAIVPSEDKELSKETLLEQYVPNLGEFKSINIPRFEISVIDNTNQIELKGSLRMVKDSAILISLNAGLGIEIARGFLTRSSIQVIDRINAEYEMLTYEQVKRIIGFNIDYEKIEKLLFNSFLISDLFEVDKLEDVFNEKDQIILQGRNSRFIPGYNEIRVFFNKEDLLVTKLEFLDRNNSSFISLEYRPFTEINPKLIFPSELILNVISPGEQKKIILKYNRIEINSVDRLHFTIPQRFL